MICEAHSGALVAEASVAGHTTIAIRKPALQIHVERDMASVVSLTLLYIWFFAFGFLSSFPRSGNPDFALSISGFRLSRAPAHSTGMTFEYVNKLTGHYTSLRYADCTGML